MDEPSSFTVAMRIALIVIFGLICPQLLGVVMYLWTKNKRKILKAFTLLIAPLTFFVISNLFWRLQVEAIRETGTYVCGAFGAAAFYSTIWETLIHFAFGLIIFSIMTFIWKKQAKVAELNISEKA